MKTLYKLPLLDPNTTDGFKDISLDDGTGWSVDTKTMSGGLQEGGRQEPWKEFSFLVSDLTPWNLIARRYGLMVGKAPHFLCCLVRS